MRTLREERDRIHKELAELEVMEPSYRDAHGGERMRRLGISDWIAEEVILLTENER